LNQFYLPLFALICGFSFEEQVYEATDGKYFPLLYSKAKIEAMAKDRLTLEPK
jgi:hypothetical protein